MLAFALMACDPEAPAPSATPTPPAATSTRIPILTPTPLPTATPRPRPDAMPFPEELERQANDLLQRVAAARNSPPMRQVDMFVMTRQQVRAFYAQPTPGPTSTPPPTSVPAVDLKQETYVLLGLIPPPQNTGGREIDDLQLDNLIPLITGFYEHEFMAFYLVEGLTGGLYGGLARSTIVHELTHALQYQYQDIDAIMRRRAGDWDATMALLDVLEGDAVNTENRVLGFSTRSTYRQPVCFAIPAPQRPGTPFVVERELDTWYEDGLCFVQAVQGRVLRGVAGIFEDLPTTTEQILHPEKYLAGEGARMVNLRQLTIGTGWQILGRANLGEFTLQNLLLLGLPGDRQRIQAAAAGWGGDEFVLYGNGEARLLYAESVWDAPEEAAEFHGAVVESLSRRGAGVVTAETPGLHVAQLGGVTWRVYRADARVTLIVSTNAATAEAAAFTVERS